ncbi:putative LRR receptor-like serine/threonine-protein kinase [Senna tora]|uniref:Putative LRR receptor-like serine/threonine-protein kinase n=1 Tax=Senna tora TaxID=362788 RepID=A0A834XA09_9FABA|nr:putative LRR receptor-like serine/threonine-protein kinase [Senna tora]
MTSSVIFLCLVIIPILAHSGLSSQPPGYLIDCGGSTNVTLGSLTYVPDSGFINVGKSIPISAPNLLPILTTVRYFPNVSARKSCFSIPVIRGGKYLVRTIYYYGRYDGGTHPPVFDQIVDGTKWSIVNTTRDFASGLSSYYEVVAAAMGNSLSVCLARNVHTGNSHPFISALEVEKLDDSVYNPTNFEKNVLVTIARNTFGADGDIISFPDDNFNRMWQPFKDQNPVVTSQSNITSSDFWNLPPAKAFNSGITTSKGKKLEIQWPAVTLPATNYYIALYFQENRSPSPDSWRVFDVAINGQTYFSKLNATTKGVTVYAPEWPLSGRTHITLTPAEGMPVGPVINAGEVFQILPVGGRTLPRDVIAMESLAKSFKNPPPDWSGDPCLPRENSWTGVTCSHNQFSRVISVVLTNAGISGSLPPDIANLTSLAHLWLGGNKLTGKIPDLSGMNALETLHLENNELEGSIPPSVGKLPKLQEIVALVDHLPESA